MTESRELELLEFIHKNCSLVRGEMGEYVIEDVTAFAHALDVFIKEEVKKHGDTGNEVHNEG